MHRPRGSQNATDRQSDRRTTCGYYPIEEKVCLHPSSIASIRNYEIQFKPCVLMPSNLSGVFFFPYLCTLLLSSRHDLYRVRSAQPKYYYHDCHLLPLVLIFTIFTVIIQFPSVRISPYYYTGLRRCAYNRRFNLDDLSYHLWLVRLSKCRLHYTITW